MEGEVKVCTCEIELREEGMVACDYCKGWSHYPECVKDPGDADPWYCLVHRNGDGGDVSDGPKFDSQVEEKKLSKLSKAALVAKLKEKDAKTSECFLWLGFVLLTCGCLRWE